jgi:hypothetical protein
LLKTVDSCAKVTCGSSYSGSSIPHPRLICQKSQNKS